MSVDDVDDVDDGSNVQNVLEAPTPTPGRRRRWPRITIVSVLAVMLLAVVATAGIGYYFSGVLLNVDNSMSYPVDVRAVNGDQVTLSRDSDTERPVVQGLWWNGGAALLSAAVSVSGDSVIRTITSTLRGTLTAGLRAAIDVRMYDADPLTDRGLHFDSVSVDGELGAMPAWFVPPTTAIASTTWVIAIHGRRGDLTEPLRILPALAATGHPTLVISYRNDPNTPRSPDGFYHLGDTEWRDVQAAVGYARAHGATGVVLYGWSMGGTLTLTALRRMPAEDVSFVRALILDSPAVDWADVLDFQGAQRDLPGFVTWTAERFVELRAGLSLAKLDGRPYGHQLGVPTLVFLDTQDRTVPNGPALDFVAAARPGLVTLVTTTGGDHTGSWNVNADAYQAKITSFLASNA
jgi:pimeloyl-ACP methyl ester carboxylesterase